jgi:glutathione synthase/RimK-type ligase-like ATP-grasp enzyme
MVLVLSYAGYEQATERVLDWLLYYRYPFLRISQRDLLDPEADWRIAAHTGRISFRGNDLQATVGAVFFRRWVAESPPASSAATANERAFREEIAGEGHDLAALLVAGLKDKFWLPHPTASERAANKLAVLSRAAAAGFPVPRTYVCRTRAEVARILDDGGRQWVTKPIKFCQYYHDGQGGVYTHFTSALGAAELAQLPERFFPSLVQERIAARLEVRVFYLQGQCYAEASYESAPDAAAAVDIKLRQGNANMHYLPYRLPDAVLTALRTLMDDLELNTGSIDLLLGQDGRYYFLEVNPVGQFSAPSGKCNYQLERRVAELLIEQDRHYGGKVPV